MAIDWGGYETNGGNGIRVGVDVNVEGSISHGETGCTFTVSYYTQNQHTWSDSQSLNLTGAIGGSISFNNSAGDGTVVKRGERSYTYTYGSNEYGGSPGSRTFGCTLQGAFNGITPSCSHTSSIPGRPYGSPAPPTGCSAERLSSDFIRLSWNNHATNGEPYDRIWLEKYIYGHAGWDRVVTLGGGAEGDTSETIPNRKYNFRVQADNSVGTSSYSTSGPVWTTPAAPSGVGRLQSGTSQVLFWNDNCDYPEYETQIWRAVSGVWSLLTTRPPGGGGGDTVNSYTDATAPTTAPVKYRFRAKTTDGVVLYSANSAETTETAGAVSAPSAPTNLSPTTDIYDPSSPIQFTWKHNSTDGTSQTAYLLQYREVGSSTWISTPKVTSTKATYTLAENTLSRDKVYEWQVQTWGASATGSAFSAVVSFPTAPTVATKYPVFFDLTSGRLEADSKAINPLPQVQLTKTTSQSIPSSSTSTQVTFDTVVYSAPSGFANLGANRLVIPEDGTYVVTAFLQWPNTLTATGYVSVLLRWNGTNHRIGRVYPSTATAVVPCAAMVVQKFTAGDYLEMFAQQTTGSAVSIVGPTSQCALEASKINDPKAVGPGGGGSGGTGSATIDVADEGVLKADNATIIDFKGDGVTAVGAGGVATVTIPKGAVYQEFVFTSASTWTINHTGFQTHPEVACYDPTGIVEYDPEISYPSPTQVVISWYNPTAGIARLMS